MKKIIVSLAMALTVPAAALANAPTPAATAPAAAATAPAPAGTIFGPAFHVADLARAQRFYVDGLGMAVLMQMGPAEHRETILSFGRDPTKPGIVLLSDGSAKPAKAIEHGHGYDRIIIQMASLEATNDRLKAAGFPTYDIREPAKGYRVVLATDPDGYQLELVQIGMPKGGK